MPKTRIQKVLFSILMPFFMVYGMEVYNSAIIKGMTNSTFLLPSVELIALMLIVIILETFIGGPIARKFAFKIVNPEKDREIAVILTIQVMTVCVMCPIMSLVATIAFKGGFTSQIIAKWVQTIAANFLMALCWQVFVAGPLVRTLVLNVFQSEDSETIQRGQFESLKE